MPLVTMRSPFGGIAGAGGALGGLATVTLGGGVTGCPGNSVTSTNRPMAVQGVCFPPDA
jgi:hypothetical protein